MRRRVRPTPPSHSSPPVVARPRSFVSAVILALAPLVLAVAHAISYAAEDDARRVAHAAFLAAEEWRAEATATLYANMTDTDWDTAARWKAYAVPDAPERSCAGGYVASQVLEDIQLLVDVLVGQRELGNHSRSRYLALHAFHSTGLEGNTLTLPETLLTIAGQPLFAGFDARVLPSPIMDISAREVHNVAQLWDALGLSGAQEARPLALNLTAIDVQALVDMNAAVTRGTGTMTGLRRVAVAIGHKRVLLPMPDEVPVLVNEYLHWLTASLHAAAAYRGTGVGGADHGAEARLRVVDAALALACDAHTRFVFVHPFADGNGRLARTLSGLVLQYFGLPAPMIPRALRSDYMAAVSRATQHRDASVLAAMHAAAVRRSLGCLIQLSDERASAGIDEGDSSPLTRALLRADCTWYHSARSSSATH